ncbi:EAL domain-containing protein [Bacillus pinisoli]|uniref:EAL domain-containing protein n=1 Tax=Bacillus pinisoli TaxID=2901866 RepID=UPI001FF63618|nr:GGDEF domain-containing phosphodiesterase [Bacillus pinisoli]
MNTEYLLHFIIILIIISMFVILFQNRSRLKKAMEHRRKFEVLFTNHPDAIFELDRNGQIVASNDLAVQLLDEVSEESTVTVRDFLNKEEYFELKEKLLEGNTVQFSKRLSLKDGRDLDIEVTGIPTVINQKLQDIIFIVKDMTEQSKAHELIHQMAYHDVLTGLPNRQSFENYLSKAIKRAKEQKKKLALLSIDLNHFKMINDSLGHSNGDMVIRELGNRLKKKAKGHLLARMGGDEFFLLIEDQSLEYVNIFAQELLEEVQSPLFLLDKELMLDCSIGIVDYPDGGTSSNLLMKAADIAMYHAKKEKKNISVYESTMNDSSHLLELEKYLRKALLFQEFELYYQPQVDVRQGRILGVEALIRWNHPMLGIVSPASFIPLAEEIGLIISIEKWVIRQACLQLRDWLDAGNEPFRVAINISAQHFQDHLVEHVSEIIKETKIPPSLIEIEITETMVMQNPVETMNKLSQLKEIGVQLAVDDFGMGYSSLKYIADFSIDRIKIDRFFIMDLLESDKKRAIVRTIIGLAQNIQVDVISEGVELKEQVLLLSELGCHQAQGYLYSKPFPAQEVPLRFDQLLKEAN